MIILVNGKKAMLKSGFSFDYISENRLFLGRDGYTLSMAFPLKDCPENIEIFGQIHRADVTKNNINFECSIISGRTSLFGTLSVVKISETEVECQFSEGRCAQTVTNPFEDVFITELDLGCGPTTDQSTITPGQAWKSIDSGANEVALPWVNENSPSVPNNWVNLESNVYTWDSENRMLSWQPYLIVIAKRICDAIGYEYDFTEWEQSPMRHIIICNTLPGIWYMPEYAKVLPEWTVSEFFEKLELFLMCEFDFDHKAQTVKMSFSKNRLEKIAPVHIEDVVDSYGVEVSQDDHTSCDYIATKRLAYKECSHSIQSYYSCDWYLANCRMIKRYDTLAELLDKNKRRDAVLIQNVWGEQMGGDSDPRIRTVGAVLYAKDVDTYFVFRSIGTELFKETSFGGQYLQIYVPQPVNVFGSGSPESDDVDTEEIEFVPVCIMDTYISKDDDKGCMMFLNPSGSNSSASDASGELPGSGSSEPAVIRQTGAASAIERGQQDKRSNYYSEIYVAFWDGSVINSVKTPFPIVDSVIVAQDWQSYHLKNFSMRLHGGAVSSEVSAKTQLPQVNARQKFKFSWLANEIPNPRATFFIKGKKYICEKITATFTEQGMSQLLRGEFYPVLEED